MKINYEKAALQLLTWVSTMAGAFIALVLLGVFARGTAWAFCLGYGC